MKEIEEVESFYTLMNKLIEKSPIRNLSEIKKNDLPKNGVYFFFEDGEYRENSESKRIVRVGTHAVQANSKSTLFKRLKQHIGPKHGFGRHRMSVQRELIGLSMINKTNSKAIYSNWGIRSFKNDKTVIEYEKQMEKLVTDYISEKMPFTVLKVDGESSSNNLRAYIERNTIMLLSNYNRLAIDPPSENWLGHSSGNDKVINSGLWNRSCVDLDKEVDSKFLQILEELINEM
jgi:hypothetical protein